MTAHYASETQVRSFHATRADLLRRLGWTEEAREAYRRALEMTVNVVERRYLERRLGEVQQEAAHGAVPH